MPELLALLGERLDQFGVCMPQCIHGNNVVKIGTLWYRSGSSQAENRRIYATNPGFVRLRASEYTKPVRGTITHQPLDST